MAKSKNSTIAIVILVIFGITGAFAYLTYDSAMKMDFDIDKITEVDEDDQYLYFEIEGTARTNGYIGIEVQKIEFEVELDGLYFGKGLMENVNIQKEPSDFIANLTVDKDDLTLDHTVVMIKLIFGQEVDVELKITKVYVLYIPFETDIIIEETI